MVNPYRFKNGIKFSNNYACTSYYIAKDGYDALMAGKDMVISGANNKMQAAMSNITPDEKLAAKMNKQQEPVHNKK